MIRLNRTPLEEAIAAQHAARVQQLHACLDAETEIPPVILDAYKSDGIKSHLRLESFNKCVYCESKVTHVYWGDVEHIKPKSLFPRNRLDIENLCLACARCNNFKLDYWDEQLPLVNPFNDVPEEELVAFGAWITRRPGRERARVTVTRLQLNRPDLLERRQERWQLLQPLADQYMVTPDGPARELIRQELIEQAAKEKEFAMVVREYLRAACGLEVADG